MPSDLRNSTMAKAMGFIFLLFDVASAQEVPFAIPMHIQCILHESSFVSHLSLLTMKGVDFVVGM